MIVEAIEPYRPSHFRVKFAVGAWERAQCAAVRRRVFCDEQGIFAGDDRDAIDAHAVPIVALAMNGVAADAVVGTVRIHAADGEAGTWWGSRLAVTREYRRVGAVGAGLIRVAVSSAHAMGCTRFLAHVQAANAAMFQALSWTTLDEVALHGRPHHLMQADLASYPPMHDPEHGLVTLLRRAA